VRLDKNGVALVNLASPASTLASLSAGANRVPGAAPSFRVMLAGTSFGLKVSRKASAAVREGSLPAENNVQNFKPDVFDLTVRRLVIDEVPQSEGPSQLILAFYFAGKGIA
jgi:hypothetical protein